MEVLLIIWFLLPIPLFILWFLARRRAKRPSGDKLNKIPDNDLEMVGVYAAEFEFFDSDKYKREITKIRDKQKSMVSTKSAITTSTEWTMGGSKKKGKQMADRAIKLSLRAFNNECEAALASVKWSNFDAMENRINKAFIQINKLNESLSILIDPRYLKLKLKELHLRHGYREKQKEERDHKTEMARQKREEERLLRDAAKAEKDEEKYQKLLDKARNEAMGADGADASKYEAQIAQLTRDLEEAHRAAERAKSMAEQTRAGYIYVISNIGSFGEGVYKIGMTRRLEPMDRVKELGDASVPFTFDVHALFYCEDAPSVEASLHRHFDQYRVNKANNRKEFFKTSLVDIEKQILTIDPNVDLITEPEAQEFRQTMTIDSTGSKPQQKHPTALPLTSPIESTTPPSKKKKKRFLFFG